MELLRRAADCDKLSVFKTVPDRAQNEHLMYATATRWLLAIQVKSVSFRDGVDEGKVEVYRPALRPSTQTWFAIFLETNGETPS